MSNPQGREQQAPLQPGQLSAKDAQVKKSQARCLAFFLSY